MTVAEMLAAARRTLDTGQPGALSAGLDFLSTVWVYESVTARAPFVTRRGGALLLVIPPEFAERLGRVDEPALAILLHEMLHCLRGHLELWGLRDDDRWVWNIALDMQVDGLVVRRMLPATAPQAARLDVASSLPFVLFLPPSVLLPRLAFLHPRAWAWAGRTDAELAAIGGDERERLAWVVAGEFRELGARKADRLARFYLDGWLTDQEPSGWVVRGAEVFAACLPPAVVAFLERCVRSLGLDLGEFRLATATSLPELRLHAEFCELPPAAIDEIVDEILSRLHCGARPELVEPWVDAVVPTAAADDTLVNIYVDVSASTLPFRPVWRALLAQLDRRLRAGKWAWGAWVRGCGWGGGADELSGCDEMTNFPDVLDHARASGAGQVIVLTDGEFDEGRAAPQHDPPVRIVFVTPRDVAQRLCGLGPVVEVPFRLAPWGTGG